MSRIRVLPRLALLGAFLVVFGSCTGDPPAPTGIAPPPPSQDLIGSLLSTTGLLKCDKLPYATTTQTVGPEGGTIVVGPHSLVIPKNALEGSVSITAEAPSSNVRAVRFYPSGLEFEKPATLTMSYQGCNLLGSLLPKRVAYTT